jgi:CelD/BcsL family acetyltransferase involved in cellulose biosynthesis
MATAELQNVSVLRDASSLAALVPGWIRLAAKAASTPMEDAIWSIACADTLDSEHPLEVVVVGGVDRPRAVAPLCRHGAELQLLGATDLHEPSDLLAEDAEALHTLTSAIADLRAPVLLHRLPAASPSIGALRWAFRPFGRVLTRNSSGHAAIRLDEEWTKPEGRLSSRRASDLRRARRRAAARGGLDVELLAPGPGEVEELLGAAFEIEARSWKGSAGTALAMDRRRGDFFRSFCGMAAERRRLRIAFLHIGGQRVAMELGLEWDSRLWLLKIGHDEGASRCSPGMLLLLEVVRAAAADGMEAVQLLGGIEPWTSMWTSDVERCVTVAAYPLGVSSLIAAMGHAAGTAHSWRAARHHN